MNTGLFQAQSGKLAPKPNAKNHAGGAAYAFTDEHALAQYAFTGTFADGYYVQAEAQLDEVLKLCKKVSPEFVAKTAVAARQQGFLKDMPAFLCVYLASLKTPEANALLAKVFPQVIDNAKMLRNFVQIMRSGVTGRKSFGQATKRLILNWLAARWDDGLFRDQVGETPSLADIIKMVHPKADRPAREALYGYLIDRKGVTAAEYEALDTADRKGKFVLDNLPPLVKHYEAFKAGDKSQGVPDVPFQMLTSLSLGTDDWADIARRAPWHMARMNINTFGRHGVWTLPEMVPLVAEKLRDKEAIAKSKVFPYQLLAAYLNIEADTPQAIQGALQDAMEHAIENVPDLGGLTAVVCPDVSGSMSSAITGQRKGATSKVRCIDVAALVAAAVLRRNQNARVIPFEGDVVLYEKAARYGSADTSKPLRLNPRDSVMTNAAKLAAIGGGSTNVSAPLALLNKENAKVDVVIIVSDNESWVDTSAHSYRNGTQTMIEWNKILGRNPKAKLICIDIQPHTTTQAQERDDILNIGGWSDNVFKVIADFAQGNLSKDHWVGLIKATAI